MLADKLRRAAAAAQPAAEPSPVDHQPRCAGGAVTRQMVLDQQAVVARIETKVNALLGGVGLAIVLDIVRSFRP